MDKSLLSIVRLACMGLLTAVSGASNADTIHKAQITEFLIKWYRNPNVDTIGDIVKIYKPVRNVHKGGTSLQLVYTYFDYTYISKVSAWSAMITRNTLIKGVRLTTSYPTGKGKTEVIIAEVNGKFHQVFKAFSENALKRNPFSMQDIDKDSYSEIVFISRYETTHGLKVERTRKDIWKWSNQLKRYRKLNHIGH